ncbi:PQQ-binding-like beta-propeller repeat protein [Kribbella italica]|uniref:Pyrroloquinoline-quinone binding quinoprotein n=1 Tax=Kribbella italica TaxID=1540520 RepID=A0A7W9MWE5_9ACTN|nr:PQQ-binding-like beta-propeller repeat protein [Kribbella italica]MBB5838951.1 hypothetical protein [Kribbella italica]
MLRPLIMATVAATLLAGCSGGDDKATDQPSSDGGPSASASSTPTGPDLATFDPPKAFTPVSALAQGNTGQSNQFNIEAGMVGEASLYALRSGLTARTLSANSWEVPASDVPTTTTNDFTAPMAVQLNGKEVVATAYTQIVQGSGTQKAHGQVSFQWIDPSTGDVLATAVADLSTLLGPGNSGKDFYQPAYDAATGQIAIGLTVSSPDRSAKIRQFTVFADPVTKKASTIPSVRAAGVLNGTVVGVKGEGGEGAKDNAIVQVDAVTGTVKKTVPVPTMNYLSPAGSGGKHAYFSGTGYVQDTKYDHHYVNSFYAVDIATGEIAEAKLPNSKDQGGGAGCLSDHVAAVVCNVSIGDQKGIAGFDDSTGKLAWKYDASANRIVPAITAIYNGLVYGTADEQAVLLDAKTGTDVPSSAATPTEGSTPSDAQSSFSGGNIGGWGDTSLLNGEPKSPVMVSKYGSVYLQDPGSKAPTNTEKILVVQKAVG